MSSREDSHSEFDTDFGGRYRATPSIVHRLPAAFPSALLGSGRPLTLRGSGHSCAGQTVTDGELLVTYSPDTAIEQIRDLGEGLFEVPAGASWHGVEQYLNRRGRALPVLPNHLHMSVGGTLSVGGAGAGSVRLGLQVDQVERIQLIDGIGASRWCSRTEHAELFRFALGGLGTVGLIERVVLRTMAHERRTHLHRAEHPTLAALAADIEQVARTGDADCYWAMAQSGRIWSVTGWWGAQGPGRCDDTDCTVAIDLPMQGSHPGKADSRRPNDPVNMWADYVVPVEHCAPMLAAVAGPRDRPLIGNSATVLYALIIRRSPDAVPFAFAPVGPAPVSVGIGIYARVEPDPKTVAETGEIFENLLRRCVELGGRPYLYGVGELDHSDALRLYGGDLDRLAELRASLRLEHVNTHLPLVRLSGRIRGRAPGDAYQEGAP
ncbi:FAD-binding protein [Nocardia sp. NPDC052254]|uniref:FAD-binding protein n=1 Tax=Nocardia sp. NPDC052254 TaxID=3155681 RepID=UPI0034433CDC